MVTYVETADNSDITPTWPSTSLFDKDMVEGATGSDNFSVSIPASSIRSASFITIANKPNSDAFEDGGTQTVELDVNMGDTDFRGRCRMVRLDSSGNILGVKGAFTSVQTLTPGTFTFLPVSPTWTGTKSCTDRLAVEWEFENLDVHSHTLQLLTRRASAEIITDITEDAGSCAGAATKFINQDGADME